MQIYEHQTKPAEQVPKPILYLGTILIALGVVIALYIALQLLSLFKGIDVNPLVADISHRLDGAVLLADGKQHFVIGPGGANIAAVIVFAIVAWAAGGIAFILIKAGTQLVSPLAQIQLAGMKLKIDQLRQEIGKNLASRISGE